MRVVTFNCDKKFQNGRNECGLEPDCDGRLSDIAAQIGPVLVVWHGDFGDGLRVFLTGDAQRHVLVVGEGVVPFNDYEPPGKEFPGRLRSFRLKSVSTWQDHPFWKRTALTRFFKNVSRELVTAPPWALLSPPVVPEHIIASYLCLIAALEPEPSWSIGFEGEVSYWSTEHNVNPRLDWNEDRINKEKLRSFLLAVGALEQSLGSGETNARG